MERSPLSIVPVLVTSLLVLAPTPSTATRCFYGDFDADGNPWTIQTSCEGTTCSVDFILEIGEISPAGRDFTIIVSEGCCQVLNDGFYGTQIEMEMASEYIDSWTATYTTCTCCSDWFIDGHFRSDAEFHPGERYVIGTGTARALCDDTWWLCVPSHTFRAEYLVDHESPCAENSIEMSLLCQVSDTPADEVGGVSHLGIPTPNPVTAELRFSVSLPEAGAALLRVYDASGAIVVTLLDENLPAGNQRRTWQPRDARGGRLASGIYFLRLDAGGVRASRLFVVAR